MCVVFSAFHYLDITGPCEKETPSPARVLRNTSYKLKTFRLATPKKITVLMIVFERMWCSHADLARC
jgi:hypothetical protein